MPTRVAIYARVSTVNHGQDVSMQTRELRQFAEARGWTIAGEYIDAGVSGAKDSRPELNYLMADAHKRHFDVVCVWRFDRFARSVSHLLRALEAFKALGIEFVSYSEQMDTSTPAGNGFYCPRRRCGVRAKSDRRASESGSTECPRQRQTHRTTNLRRGCFADCVSTSRARFLAGDWTQVGRQCANREASGHRAWQKPLAERVRKCRRLSSDLPGFARGRTIRLCPGLAVTMPFELTTGKLARSRLLRSRVFLMMNRRCILKQVALVHRNSNRCYGWGNKRSA
jgi:hypothetical protein